LEEKFGMLLKKLREEQGLSMTGLAESTGVSVAHISRMERGLRGVPSPDIIQRLARVLGHFEEMMLLAGHLPDRSEAGISAAQNGNPARELDEEGWMAIAEFEDFIFRKYGWDPGKKHYGSWLEKKDKK
jgi:transcriptional regulator with XRE-family HTH domain